MWNLFLESHGSWLRSGFSWAADGFTTASSVSTLNRWSSHARPAPLIQLLTVIYFKILYSISIRDSPLFVLVNPTPATIFRRRNCIGEVRCAMIRGVRRRRLIAKLLPIQLVSLSGQPTPLFLCNYITNYLLCLPYVANRPQSLALSFLPFFLIISKERPARRQNALITSSIFRSVLHPDKPIQFCPEIYI